LDARADLTVNAITAVIDRLQLPPDRKAFALESAAAILGGEEPPEPPEPVTDRAADRTPWPFRADGVEYVVIKGVRYVREGLHEPADLPYVDAEVIEPEGEGGPMTADRGGAGPGVPDDDPEAVRLELEAAKAEFPDLEWGDDD
jgi:hypothetical protein